MPITATPYTSVLSVPDNRILGNNSGGTAAAIALTPAQVATMLALISDTAYNEATWNGVTDIAPSKNAVRDWIETLGSAAYTASSAYATAGHNHSGVYDPAGTAAALVANYVPLAGGTWTGPMTGTGNLVEFRNGTNAQTIRLDKTWTSSTNFEALRIDASSSGPRIGSEVGSAGGTTQDLDFGYWDSAAAWISNLLLDTGTSTAVTLRSDVVSSFSMYTYQTGINASTLRFYKARGNDRDAPTAVAANDAIANLASHGYDGTVFSTSVGNWSISAAEAFTATAWGTYQTWSTIATGTTSLVNHMRLHNDGSLVIGYGSAGVTSTGGALEVKSTTEQLRLWHSAANYMTTTVSSAGAVTFDTNGASASFTFSDSVSCSSSIKSTNATAGIGYGTGAGGTVTQATNKSTGVTINKTCGTITLNGAALAADTTVSFTVTNSACAATDMIPIQHDSAGTLGAYLVSANTPAAGSFQVSIRNVTAGSLSEAIVLRFAIIKAVTS